MTELPQHYTQFKMENKMQIILNEVEIREAIEAKVRAQITIADSQDISIDLKAGRGPEGFTASLEITDRPVQAGKKAVRKLEPKDTGTVGDGCGLPERPADKSLFDEDKVVDDRVEDPQEDAPTLSLGDPERAPSAANNIFGD